MINARQREELIQKNIDLLGISYAEAAEMIDDDIAIDKGMRCEWEPTEEEEKQMRKNTKLVAERAKPTKRTREPNQVKLDLIGVLAAALLEADYPELRSVAVTNAERLIEFKVGDDSYSITLTKRRG